jgi:hypothetical protein
MLNIRVFQIQSNYIYFPYCDESEGLPRPMKMRRNYRHPLSPPMGVVIMPVRDFLVLLKFLNQ